MTEPIRIPVDAARSKATAGTVLLVCAYDDDEKFRKNHLEGALSFEQFLIKKETLPKNQDIIFYCA